MKKWLALLPLLAMVCFVAGGCGGKDEKKDEKKDEAKDDSSNKNGGGGGNASETPVGNFACTGCGGKAEEGHKCAADGEVCKSCNMHKGSALCCKIAPDKLAKLEKGKRLCLGCGHIAEDGHKCDESHAKCEKCGKHADSLLCNCAAGGTSDKDP